MIINKNNTGIIMRKEVGASVNKKRFVSMRVYRVKVNGKVYEVELESVTEKAGSMEMPKKAVNDDKPQNKKAAAGENVLRAPMQGSVIDVKVQTGQTVKRGDVLIVLEAMKLENNIVAPESGVIGDILVSKGDSVENKQPLLIIK